MRNYINKTKTRFEIGVAKGILSDIFKEADWNIQNLNTEQKAKVTELNNIIRKLEACL